MHFEKVYFQTLNFRQAEIAQNVVYLSFNLGRLCTIEFSYWYSSSFANGDCVKCAVWSRLRVFICRAREALRQCLPDQLRDATFANCLQDDKSTKHWLSQLLKNLETGPVTVGDPQSVVISPLVPQWKYDYEFYNLVAIWIIKLQSVTQVIPQDTDVFQLSNPELNENTVIADAWWNWRDL